MKRLHQERYKYLDRCFPLFFWQHCCICKKEFRREWGWRALTGPFYNGSGVVRFLCGSCAPTRELADEIFLGNKWLGPRPNLPTPSPPPKTQGGQNVKSQVHTQKAFRV